MLFDGIIRMVITLSSQYYRMIQLPEALFGIIGSMVAMLGFIVPRIARKIAEQKAPAQGLWITAALTISGLTTMSFFWPWTGLLPALVTFSAMYFNGFFVSFYVNRETASQQRATVLSFKGLSYNLSYGILGTGYALLLKTKKQALEPEFFWRIEIWGRPCWITSFSKKALHGSPALFFKWGFCVPLPGLFVFHQKQIPK